MSKSKLIKALLAAICLAFLSSGAALASASGDAVESPQPDEPTRILDREPYVEPYSEEILNKQREIDQYLFVDSVDHLVKQGIRITHTSPHEDFVEIGITPYTQESANYLYDIFGTELVQVVEGRQATTLPMPADGETPTVDIDPIAPDANQEPGAVPSEYQEHDQALLLKHREISYHIFVEAGKRWHRQLFKSPTLQFKKIMWKLESPPFLKSMLTLCMTGSAPNWSRWLKGTRSM